MKIPLSGIKGNGLYALVDDEDYALLSQFSWSLSRKGYVQAYMPVRFREKYGCSDGIHMQRLLLYDVVKAGQFVDHINRDKLDNRKANLRVCSLSESNQNRGAIHFSHRQPRTSRYKGVWWDRNKWRSAITINGEKRYLGRFSTEEEAALAYNEAASLYFGDFACLNVL